MFSKIQKRMKGEKGFTLIELLVVIIIIAILAAIAIPTFLGQRQKAQDAAAKSLVRNAMTALESTYVDTQTYAATQAQLIAIEPSIKWPTAMASAPVATIAPALAVAGTALASGNIVDWYGTATAFSVGSISASGNVFGVVTDKSAGGGTTFVKRIGAATATPTAGW